MSKPFIALAAYCFSLLGEGKVGGEGWDGYYESSLSEFEQAG